MPQIRPTPTKKSGRNKKKELVSLAKECAKVLKKKYKVKRVFLIGSLAKGFVHDRSDIDLVAVGLPSEVYIKALTELYDLLPPGTELNLIPYEDAFHSLKEKTSKEGKLIYG